MTAPSLFVRASGLSLLAAALSVPAEAQQLTALIRRGEPILGNGVFNRVEDLKVNNNGTWIAECTANYTLTADNVILRDGFMATREGANVSEPAGANLKGFESIDINDAGRLVMSVTFNGVSAQVDSGLMLDGRLIFQEDDILDAEGFGAGTVWDRFQVVKINDRNQFLLAGEVMDPTIGSNRDDMLILCEFNDDLELTSIEQIALEGREISDSIAGRDLRDVHNLTHNTALTNEGDYMWSAFITGPPPTDTVILINDTVIAQEGMDAPVTDRRWRDIGNKPLHMNDDRQFIFWGLMNSSGTTPELQATDSILVTGQLHDDGTLEIGKFVQEGDVIPSLAPHAIIEPSNNALIPSYYANNGHIYWIAQTNNPASLENEAVMRDFDIVFQRGLATVDGVTIQTIRSAANGMHVSRDGRYMMVEVNLLNVGESIVFMDFGTIVPIDQCEPSGATLESVEGMALPGDSLTFVMDGAQGLGVQPFLFFSPRRLGGECGVDLGFGEVLINSPIAHTQMGIDYLGTPTEITVNLPPDLSLADTTWYLQGLYVDVGDQLPEEDFRLTNGLKMEIGRP